MDFILTLVVFVVQDFVRRLPHGRHRDTPRRGRGQRLFLPGVGGKPSRRMNVSNNVTEIAHVFHYRQCLLHGFVGGKH